MSVTANLKSSTEAQRTLQRVFSIRCPAQFQKKGQLEKVRALINSDSEVNAMPPAFAARLGFITWATNLGA